MAWCSRSGARENVGITPWRKVFSPPSSESSSTLEHGQRVPVCTEPSSTTSRVGTTLAGFTARSTTAAQPSGSPSTATSTVKRHNQHKQPVRRTGSSPLRSPGSGVADRARNSCEALYSNARPTLAQYWPLDHYWIVLVRYD